VFLFMAATVVSVVIFLFGVLVGRGVRAERQLAADSAPANTVAETTPQQPAAAPPVTPAGSDPTAAAPPPNADDLSYFSRMEKAKSPSEALKPAPTASAPPTPAPAPPAPEKPVDAAAAAASSPKAPVRTAAPPAVESGEAGGQGYAVQIAALNVR